SRKCAIMISEESQLVLAACLSRRIHEIISGECCSQLKDYICSRSYFRFSDALRWKSQAGELKLRVETSLAGIEPANPMFAPW
ncbi:MAG TPA: hypothetical protein VFU09_01810, partial [Candidatus Udaeobacter sp.]|nr:hypothetical protein [Candidatus Udaeobacter sp.]